MTVFKREGAGPTRRGLLGAVGLAAVAATPALASAEAPELPATEPFFGTHQGGIITPQQRHGYFAAFDLQKDMKRRDLAALMRSWTAAAASLSAGRPIAVAEAGGYAIEPDMSEVAELGAARLTLTFGFGPDLFAKQGVDRFGLRALRPEAFVDLPNFPGEQLMPERTGGDLFVQVCAENAQVAFRALRQLALLAEGQAVIRWVQAGFMSDYGKGATPRNLMGFKDGTGNPSIGDAQAMEEGVWVGSEAPAWMRGGTYLVIRRARIALEHWERTKVDFQEQTFGRHKRSGAPLGKAGEFDEIDLAAVDADENPVIPENSHVRIAHEAVRDGARMLRRSYSYSEGANIIAERWPPWHRGMEFDAGLVFVAFQRDLRNGFIKIFDKLARFDMMNQFVTNTGGGHFACPGGVKEGEYIGQRLLES